MLKHRNCMSEKIILEGAIQRVNLENFILEFLTIWILWDFWVNKSKTVGKLILEQEG